MLRRFDDGVMEQLLTQGLERRIRVHRSVAEKRRIVELTFAPGASVAQVAQAAGVNANQVFKWRREYGRSGRMGSAALLPVVLTGGDVVAAEEQERQAPEVRKRASLPMPQEDAQPTTGAIHIELPGRAMISVEHGADCALLRTVLESLRK
jgi:transposase